MHTFNILFHALAGTLAIFAGIVAYRHFKNARAHRHWGRVFLWLIGASLLGAFAGVIFFVDRPFLTVVSIQASYMTVMGWRIQRLKNRGLQPLDGLFILLTAAGALFFLWKLNSSNQSWHLATVVYLLSYLFLVLLIDFTRWLFPRLLDTSSERFWLYDHVFKMTSAFSACVAAGMGSLFPDYGVLTQLVPAGLTTAWIVFALFYFPRRWFNLRARS